MIDSRPSARDLCRLFMARLSIALLLAPMPLQAAGTIDDLLDIDEANICRTPGSPLDATWTVADAGSQRQAADQLMLMMQDMAGISVDESPWIRAKNREGFYSDHERHAAAGPSDSGSEADARIDQLLQAIGVDRRDASVRVAARADAETLASDAARQDGFEGLFVDVLPGGNNPVPAEADRHYRVAAIDMDIVYNRFGGHDTGGKVFVLEQHREMVQRGSGSFNGGHDPLFYGVGYLGDLPLIDSQTGAPDTDNPGPVIPVEPLVLRANRGETVVIDFTNRLSAEEPANLMINGAAYNTAAIDGGDQAPLPAPDIEDGYQLRYIVTVGEEEATEGTYYFRSRPVDFENISAGLTITTEQIRRGLFGALIIEPPDAIYLDPSAYTLQAGSEDGRGGYAVDPDSYQEATAGWSAIIASPTNAFPAFREHVIFFHDDLSGDSMQGLLETDPKAIGYRAEPFADIFSPGVRPRIETVLRPFAVNDRSMAYSAYTYGDSSTPHPRFYVGDPMRYRVLHAGIGNEFHVFHHHAHRWRTQPGVREADEQQANVTSPSKWGRPEFPNQPDVTASRSSRIDSQTLGPAETFDVFMEGGAGGAQRTVGDTLLHCHIIQHVTKGMWTYARIYNTLQRPTPQMPGLAPLPDRLGPTIQPPITVDSVTLATMVEDGAGPTPVGGPLAGQPIDDVEHQLLPFLDAQLPTSGIPDLDKTADDDDTVLINYADKWDWTTVDDAGRQLYLGAPWDFGDDSFVKFGIGFPTIGEGVGAVRDETTSDGTPLDRPKLLFNPDDGRLAYPHLLPQAGQRPPFAPRKTLVCNDDTGETRCSVQSGDEGQGTAYLGPVLGLDDPGRDGGGEALGVPTGSGLAPEEAAGDPDRVKHYDIVALQLPVDYATHSGAKIDGAFGNAGDEEDDGVVDGPRQIEIIGGDSPGNWTVEIDDVPASSEDVIINAGDTITWWVEADRHGVTFPEWNDAQLFLDFDELVGREFVEQNSDSFGPNNRGTEPVRVEEDDPPVILARATVKEQGDQSELEYICTAHGPNAMRGRLCFGECSPDTVDQNAQLFVLADDVPDIMAGRKRAEPLVIRANVGDVIDITLKSALPDQNSNQNYSKVGKHVHLVQYDVQSSDGAVGGLNYETSVRPSLSWNPYTDRLEPIPEAEAHQEVVNYRWWADAELGMTYFHDHSLLKDSLKHGLFGAIVIEPANATYHDPDTGDPIYVADADGRLTATTSIGGTTRADIRIAGDDGSEASAFREFVPMFNDGFESAINLRNESLANRIEIDSVETPLQVHWQGGRPFVAGGIETAFSSILHGDPPTNTWRAIAGDDIRVRTEGGSLNEIHTLNLHNNHFRFEANNPMSTVRDFALVGVSEAFSFELGNDGLQAADYLYRSGGTNDVVNNGKWGLLRVYEGPEAGALARGELRLELDSPTSVTIAADQIFYSMRGTEFVPEEAIAISQEDVEANLLQTLPPRYIVDIPVEAVRATDEANLPAGTPFATKLETLQFGNAETKVVTIVSESPMAGGVSPLLRLTGADTAPPAEPEIDNDSENGAPPDDRVMLAPADEPTDVPGAVEFHIAAVPVKVPDRSTEDAPITIDAATIGGNQVWTSNGEQDANLKILAELGDILVFRQADDSMPHGLRFITPDQVQLIGETEAAKPDAVLRELGEGASAVGQFIGAIASGTPPQEFARFEVIREIAEPINFVCILHGQMRGNIDAPEPGEVDEPGTDALVYMQLQPGEETDLAEMITSETRAGGSTDVLIDELVALLNTRFAERPEPLVLRVAAGQPLGDGTSEPVDVVVRLTNLLPLEADRPLGPDSEVSAATSLHASLVSYDQEASDGTATGMNDHSLVVRGDSRNYHWIVDRPVGAARFADMADPRRQLRGLFGALIVAPHGSTVAPAIPGDDGRGWQALVRAADPDDSFREFVLFLHDGWPGDGFAINYYSARDHAASAPTPHLRAHRSDRIVIREVHAAGQGGFTNLTFFAEPVRARLDMDDPRSNRIAAIANAPGAVFNLALNDLSSLGGGASDRTEKFLYGSHVGNHLTGGMWGLFELLPDGDPSILPLDEAEEQDRLDVAVRTAAAASTHADVSTGQHHVVTATRNQWLYKGRRSGKGEGQALRIPVVPGDTIEFRQSDGDHGVFFYLTRMTDGSELGRAIDVGASFEIVAGEVQLEPMASQQFVSTNLASEIGSGKRDIVTIRFDETWDQPLYFGDPNTSTDARRRMFGALIPVRSPDVASDDQPRTAARLAAESARSGPGSTIKATARSVPAAPASLDLGALTNDPDAHVVLRDGELRIASRTLAADVPSPMNDRWFRNLPAVDPKIRHWYQSLSVDLDRDGDLDVVAAIESEDRETWQWWLFESNVTDRPGLGDTDFQFKDARPLSPEMTPASSGPDAMAAAADIDNDGQVDLLTYQGAGAVLTPHLNVSATSSKNRLSFVQAATGVDLGALDGRRPDLIFADDLDLDGWSDLIVSGSGRSQVFFNDAEGHFPSQAAITLPESDDPIRRINMIERRAGIDRRFELALENAIGETAFYAIDERRRIRPLQ